MISLWYFPVFLALGAVVSVEDWRERKVRNQWVLLGLLLCLGGLALGGINTAAGYAGLRVLDLGEWYLPWQYYPKVLVHLALSLAAALALWRWHVWPAGDAKLFTVFAFFLVLIEPNLPGFPLMLFLLLLVNTFVPPGLLFAAETLARLAARAPRLAALDWGRELKALAERVRIRLGEAWPFRWNYLALAVNLFCLFWAFRLVQHRFTALAIGPFATLALYLALFVLWGRLTRVLYRPWVSAAALAALSAASCAAAFGLGVDIVAVALSGLRMTVDFGLFFNIARLFLDAVLERQTQGALDPEAVRPGALLSEDTWERLRGEPALREALGRRYPDGLSQREAEAIRAWLASDEQALERARAGWKLYETIPFAVWVFVGSLMTLCRPRWVVGTLLPLLVEATGTAWRWTLGKL